MEHYSAEMWQQYITGRVDQAQALAMENHLVECDRCLELYALGAENSFSHQAVYQQVSSQFTAGVMAQVAALEKPHHVSGSGLPSGSLLPVTTEGEIIAGPENLSPLKKASEQLVRSHRNQRPRSLRKSLGNYAVAACLTLMLTAGGIFGDVASAVPQVKGLDLTLADRAAQKMSSGWSDVVAEKTLSILDIVKPD